MFSLADIFRRTPPFDPQKLQPLFGVTLNASQVAGVSAIAAAFYKRGYTDKRLLTYFLATAFHETAKTMQPIEEYGKGAGRGYGIPDATTGKAYFGRGYVQLTWRTNYAKASQELGVDFVHHPELALQAPYAIAIMFSGMMDGWFTGHKLTDYFSVHGAAPISARMVVNGSDCAVPIAGYYNTILKAVA